MCNGFIKLTSQLLAKQAPRGSVDDHFSKRHKQITLALVTPAAEVRFGLGDKSESESEGGQEGT